MTPPLQPHPLQPHPEFANLTASWALALNADGYAANTVYGYGKSVAALAAWLAEHHDGLGPTDVTRDHIRAWIVATRERTSSSTARAHFQGVKSFFRWAIAEDEMAVDPTEGIRTPPPNEARTEVLSLAELRALLATCTGSTFIDRRDAAIIYLFADGGLRLAEVSDLKLDSADMVSRMVFVEGKGSNRSGPRRRAVPLGVKATRALDRYLRERRRHPYAALPQLWLGDRGRAACSAHGVKAALVRRAVKAGIDLHPHKLRHTWAHHFRAAGGSEGDLMVLGGWSNRTMLDRYGKSAAAERAQEAYRSRALGDRL